MIIKKNDNQIVEDLMNEDINKVLIKHNFLSQQDVIDDLIEHVSTIHEKKLNVYFNSLKGKLTRIISTINILAEKNDSLVTAYNTFVGIKNNNSVTRLTFVNAIFMPLTLIAGIGGMSERSMMTGPENWKITYPLFFLLCGALAYVTYFFLRKSFIKK
jgi:Mg2+ and Co2+ transporter CorA